MEGRHERIIIRGDKVMKKIQSQEKYSTPDEIRTHTL